jgi:hypothetical protein
MIPDEHFANRIVYLNQKTCFLDLRWRWIVGTSDSSAMLVDYWSTKALTGDGGLGFDPGEGA